MLSFQIKQSDKLQSFILHKTPLDQNSHIPARFIPLYLCFSNTAEKPQLQGLAVYIQTEIILFCTICHKFLHSIVLGLLGQIITHYLAVHQFYQFLFVSVSSIVVYIYIEMYHKVLRSSTTNLFVSVPSYCCFSSITYSVIYFEFKYQSPKKVRTHLIHKSFSSLNTKRKE